MKPHRVLGALALALLFFSSSAAPPDGLNLSAGRGPGSADVTLDWMGGQPSFHIYRSASPVEVVQPPNLVGDTTVRTWTDTPPVGRLFFYVVTSDCVVTGPEVCDGVDNNCDGGIDEPGAETSCNEPNAVPACVGGACAIASCDAGFGDCNSQAADGCETDLLTDPSHCGACTVDCDGSLDVCHHSACAGGACGEPFDRSRCLAPAGITTSAGACAFAAAGCSVPDTDGDGLSDTWEDAGMIDFDCNGVYDSNDVSLPDANRYVKDVYVRIAYMGPSTRPYPVQDTTVPGCPTVTLSEPATGHRPQEDSIDFVKRAFAGAHLKPQATPCGKAGDAPCPSGSSCVEYVCLPDCTSDADCAASCNMDCESAGGAKCVPRDVGGVNVCRLWRLHVDPLPTSGVAHHDIVSLGPISPACANTAGGGSMTPGDQVNFFDYKAPPNFDPKEAAFKRFALFAHDNTCFGTGSPGCGDRGCPLVDGEPPKPATSGISEIRGNDSIVTLGVLQFQAATADRVAAEAGTFMHEIGHNLGLNHYGGPAAPRTSVTKVNYLSVMDYLYQTSGIPYAASPGSTVQVGARPDYSHQALTTVLDESRLSEAAGVGSPGLQDPSSRDLIKYVHDNTPVCPCPIDPCTGLPSPTCGGLGSGSDGFGHAPPIDWNCDGTILTAGWISADINGNGILGESHDPTGTADWMDLFFSFQCQSSYTDGPSGPAAQGRPLVGATPRSSEP